MKNKIITREQLIAEFKEKKAYYDNMDYTNKAFRFGTFDDIEQKINVKLNVKERRAITILYDIFFTEIEVISKNELIEILSQDLGLFLLLMRKYKFIDIHQNEIYDKISKDYLKSLIIQSKSDDSIKQDFLYVLEKMDLRSEDTMFNISEKFILLTLLDEADIENIMMFCFYFLDLFKSSILTYSYSRSHKENNINIYNKNNDSTKYLPMIYCYGNFSKQNYVFWLEACLLNGYNPRFLYYDANISIEKTKLDNAYGRRILKRKSGNGFNSNSLKYDFIYLHPDREDNFKALLENALLSLNDKGSIYLNVGLDNAYKMELPLNKSTVREYQKNTTDVKQMIVENDILEVIVDEDSFIIEKNKSKKGLVRISKEISIDNKIIKYYNYNMNKSLFMIPNAVSLAELFSNDYMSEKCNILDIKEDMGAIVMLSDDPFMYDKAIYKADINSLSPPLNIESFHIYVESRFDPSLINKNYIKLISNVVLLYDNFPFNTTWCPASIDTPIVYEENNDYFVFSIVNEKVDVAFLAYELTKPYVKQQYEVFVDPETETISMENLLKIRISLPSLEEQKKILMKAKIQEFGNQQKRLNQLDIALDMGHSLGMPISRIQSILGPFLEKKQEDGLIYDKLKKINDNINLVNRIIESKGNFNQPLYMVDLKEFIDDYLEAWDNLPYKSFIVKPTIYELSYPAVVMGDKIMLSIMMDNILTNAHKHGFNKTENKENFVQIKLNQVTYQGNSYVCLSVGNNGKPFETNFSIQDYITKGFYGKCTGITGIGGYDIYRIIKKMNGYLSINKSDEYFVIIDVLLPIESNRNVKLKKYISYEIL